MDAWHLLRLTGRFSPVYFFIVAFVFDQFSSVILFFGFVRYTKKENEKKRKKKGGKKMQEMH